MTISYCAFCRDPFVGTDTIATFLEREVHGGCLADYEWSLMKDSRFEDTGYSHYGELMW